MSWGVSRLCENLLDEMSWGVSRLCENLLDEMSWGFLVCVRTSWMRCLGVGYLQSGVRSENLPDEMMGAPGLAFETWDPSRKSRRTRTFHLSF